MSLLIPCLSFLSPGSVVEQVSATDADTGDNAVISYRIQRGGYDDFSIDKDTGVITVARKMDFDRRQQYDIKILATDGGNAVLWAFLLQPPKVNIFLFLSVNIQPA